jgi:2-polyprenyl-3-methyl-5-hydroxy-6-metoxy-1,4-benzoquinol methylase
VSYGWTVISGAPAAVPEWPQEGLERVERCPACDDSSRRLLYADLTDRTYLVAPGHWRLFRCERCSSAYLDPRPSEQSVHLAYGGYYRGAEVRAARDVRGWRRLRRSLRNGYLNSRYGYHFAPSSRLGPLLVPLLRHYREQADELVRHLPARVGHRRLLDVGSGEGEFLAEMQALGWEVEGIEPSAEGVAIASSRGVSVAQSTFAEASLEAEQFDAITIRLVFEALPDPFAVLAKSHRALKPDGILWIASPSLESEAHRIFGRDWFFLDPPRNAVLYTASSLTRLLRRVGFEVDAVRPSRQAQRSFRLSAAVAAGLPPFRQPPHLSRRMQLRARLADLKALRRPELADVVVLVARKS